MLSALVVNGQPHPHEQADTYVSSIHKSEK